MQLHNSLTWSICTKKTQDLTPADYNPRKMTAKERTDLEKSIQSFGAVEPLILNTNGTLIGGHQRLKIYLDLQIDTVDVMIPSRELTIEEEKELNLRLNKNTGSWDIEKLLNFDVDLLTDIGFSDSELLAILEKTDIVDDAFDLKKALEETKVAKVKTGELWQLGDHRLLVGDSTNPDHLALLMRDDKAHIIYCDPPYNIGLDYGKGIGNNGNKYGGNYSGKKDSKNDSEYELFLSKSLGTALQFSHTDVHVFYWCDSNNIGLLQNLYKEHGVTSRRVCMWVKNNQNPTPQVAFNKVYEPCVYGTVGKPYLNSNLNNIHEVLNQEISSGNKLHDEILEMTDLWVAKRDSGQEYEHPTQKPITLNEKPLRRCSSFGHIVFSGFGGSGSDLLACEALKLQWRGVEQDPIFATVIIDRFEKVTSKKAIKLT
jgi:DNA modification methylase